MRGVRGHDAHAGDRWVRREVPERGLRTDLGDSDARSTRRTAHAADEALVTVLRRPALAKPSRDLSPRCPQLEEVSRNSARSRAKVASLPPGRSAPCKCLILLGSAERARPPVYQIRATVCTCGLHAREDRLRAVPLSAGLMRTERCHNLSFGTKPARAGSVPRWEPRAAVLPNTASSSWERGPTPLHRGDGLRASSPAPLRPREEIRTWTLSKSPSPT